MTEFTGERVVLGYVSDDLWAEHLARYAYAATFAAGKRILDAGCGTGYGSLELAEKAASAVGADVAKEAVDYARQHSAASNLFYVQAPAEALPFRAASFDLLTAFEVIEHLNDWRGLLQEARRVLTPEGILLVSTPNKIYYAESREKEGPNPFHVHEFEFAEFQSALREFFPNVSILFQNRVEAFSFLGAPSQRPPAVRLQSMAGSPDSAHFFVAICSGQPLPELAPFVYVPRAANVLREREQHIRLLEGELAQTRQWLDQNIADHAALQQAHEAQTGHLAEQNRWAQKLDQRLGDAQARIVQLQEELVQLHGELVAVASGYSRKVADLEQENREKTQWAIDTETRLTADLAARAKQLADTVALLDRAEQTVVERTQWAQRLEAALQHERDVLGMIRESRWVKLGRAVGVGPQIERPKVD